jgi:hypothetical protein
MMKTFFGLCLAIIYTSAPITKAQNTIQGDSAYRALQVYHSTLSTVIAQLGRPSVQKELLGTRTSKFRDGSCTTSSYVCGHSLYYRKENITFYIDEKSSWVEEIHFNSSSHIISSKGIQLKKSKFADVLANYGMIDFDKKIMLFPSFNRNQ